MTLKKMITKQWKSITTLSNIPVLGSIIFDTGTQQIAIFRTRDDSVFALHNACPHESGTLSEGIVHSHKVTCPLHNWVISLEDGQAQGADKGQVACFDTKVENGFVYLKI